MQRLDSALAERGLARSRTHAAKLIADGLVTVDGQGIVRPAARVALDAVLEVAASDHYVSRAAHKLVAALDGFGIEVTGRLALDMGASTGGFTQVLRERGADPVIAVDVGHGQLSEVIRADPGVLVIEGYNVRYMTPASLTEVSGVSASPEVITGDLSFISLSLVLPAVKQVAPAGAEIILLIKPQFEVGRTAVKGGLVTNDGARTDAVAGVLWSAWDAGLGTVGILPSPIVGTHGNSEFLVHLRHMDAPGARNPTEWLGVVDALTKGAT